MSLMSYEEYRKNKHKIPYTLILESDSNLLYYFGERHSFNPDDEQWIEEKKFWQDFLEKTAGQKRIVFIEGNKRPYEETEEQSIIHHGGMGLATYLAHQENIEIYSPEPDGKYERDEMEKIFSREQIQYYYFARTVLQWCKKQDPKPNFEEYITQYLERDKTEGGWGDFDFSLDSMKNIHFDIFNTVFNEKDIGFFESIINPGVKNTDINQVSGMSMVIRDEYIVKEIQRYIDNGFSIFAQFGCSHVVIQEPLLREVLGNSQENS